MYLLFAADLYVTVMHVQIHCRLVIELEAFRLIFLFVHFLHSHSLIFVLMSRPNPLPLFFVCFTSIYSQSIRIGFIRFFIESRLLGDRESTLLRLCILGYATSVYHIWLEIHCVYVEILRV